MIYLAVAVAVFVLDLVVKYQIDKKRKLGETTPVLKGHIIIRKYYNDGIAFDRLRRWPHLVRVLCGSSMAVLCGIWAVVLKKDDNAGLKLGLSFVVGGGASNLYDRFTKGHVVDYFSIKSRFARIQRIIFNISDWFIFIGSICVALSHRKKG